MTEIEEAQTTSLENIAAGKHYIEVNGEKVYYIANITNPKQQTVLMVHGAGAFAESWKMVIENFTSHEFNTIMFDMPGHLRSTGDAFTSIKECADFIDTLVNALVKEYHLKNEFTLVGHSYGGAITGEVAIRNYEWLKNIILVGTSSCFENVSSDEFMEKLKNGEMDLRFYKRGFSPSSPDKLYDIIVNSTKHVSLKATYADFFATTTYNNTEDFVKINKPTLIIEGKDDIIMPKGAGTLMHSKIKDSKLIRIEHAGHFLTTEAFHTVAQEIQAFILKNN